MLEFVLCSWEMGVLTTSTIDKEVLATAKMHFAFRKYA